MGSRRLGDVAASLASQRGIHGPYADRAVTDNRQPVWLPAMSVFGTTLVSSFSNHGR